MSEVVSIWYQPESDDAQECISVEVFGGPKRYLRLWPRSTHEDDRGGPLLEWGWRLHPTAKEVYRDV